MLSDEVESMFAEIESDAREDQWIRTCIARDEDRRRLRELRAETQSDPFRVAKRKRSQCEYVKRREVEDSAYRSTRRTRSREYARELSDARRAVEADRFWERACPLPGLRAGIDIPVPVPARLKTRVDEVRSRLAQHERSRRARARRVDSCPLREGLQ
jgi:hypothetical protein